MTQSADSLLLQITRCPIAAKCLAGQQHACSTIVGSQGAVRLNEFHVPEPWSGHIGRAPVLFVSSNPSIDRSEAYPTGNWDDHKRADFFSARFDQRTRPWIDSRMRPLLATSPQRHRDKGTRFWFATQARATELLRRPAQAGHDFALTEVVHCKSASEVGVAEAFDTCVKNWLRPMIRAAGAKVIVLLGKQAQRAFQETHDIVAGVRVTGPRRIEGVERIVLQLPHPNARTEHRNCYPLTAAELTEVQRYLHRN